MNRLVVLAIGFGFVTTIFISRLIHLQIFDGERLASAVDQSRLMIETTPPQRGKIYDRNGQPLVTNRSVYHLAVTLSDLESTGKARKDVPFWRLNEIQFDAWLADLAVGLPRITPTHIRKILIDELTAHPGTALRTGSRRKNKELGLLMIQRSSLQPNNVPNSDAEILATSDLLSSDPRIACEQELSERWKQSVTLCTEAEYSAITARIDDDFHLQDERSDLILGSFFPSFAVHISQESGPLTLSLRLIETARRDQAEQVLGSHLNELPQLVHERFDIALAAARAQSPMLESPYYFGASAKAENIASLLPTGSPVQEIPLSDVPSLHERVFIIQGDALNSKGLFSHVIHRLGNSLGSDPELIAALLRRHAEPIKAMTCDRDYRTHHLVFDPQRYERFTTRVASDLTLLGRPTSTLDVEQALAHARIIADRSWTGQTYQDPIPFIYDLTHDAAIRCAEITTTYATPAPLRNHYDETDSAVPGLSVAVDLSRSYHFPGSSSHLIGTISKGDDPEPSASHGWAGTSGLEKRYDALLRGLPGTLYRIRTPDGFTVLHKQAPESGVDLRTELDMEVQVTAEDALSHWYELADQLGTATERMDKARDVGKGRAGFVLLDCHTGALLACATAPGYNLDTYRSEYHHLVTAPGNPLRNWAVEADVPPGSSMKICTALAGLSYNTLVPGEFIHSQGYMQMVNGQKILRDHAEPGDYDLIKAIQVSSNVYFATVAARLNRQDPNRLSDVSERFGLGQIVGIDVPGERPGILPSPALYTQRKRKWMPSDSWFLGIGQSLTASPLQVACIAAAVANGGRIVRPFLVQPDILPEVKDLRVRKEWLNDVRRGMELVTSNLPGSTARYLQLEGVSAGIKIAAKTGTSEWGNARTREQGLTPNHAWLIGYAPADKPTVAFACFIHSGTSGGAATSGVVKRVLECYFAKYGRGGHRSVIPVK